jgi:biotin transporter BioY
MNKWVDVRKNILKECVKISVDKWTCLFILFSCLCGNIFGYVCCVLVLNYKVQSKVKSKECVFVSFVDM